VKGPAFQSSDSLFQQFILPYLKTMVKLTYKKEILVHIVDKQLKQIFSKTGELSFETKQQVQNMLKQAIIDTFEDDVDQMSTFRLGPKLSSNSEEVLLKYWDKLAQLYESKELYDL
jgi:DNA integrity scanning protein DisA with diadenylate cyclase activity